MIHMCTRVVRRSCQKSNTVFICKSLVIEGVEDANNDRASSNEISVRVLAFSSLSIMVSYSACVRFGHDVLPV